MSNGDKKVPGHEWVYLIRDVTRLLLLGSVAWAATVLSDVDKLVSLHSHQLNKHDAELISVRERLRDLEKVKINEN